MADADPSRDGGPGVVLVINSGSSSVKFALFDGEPLHRLCSGSVERIGLPKSSVRVVAADRSIVLEETGPVADHHAALARVLMIAEAQSPGTPFQAVGHRVVHGGPDCDCPVVVTAAEEARLRRLIPFAPLHQPHNLAGIAAVRAARPELPQVACFDTAFHHGLPRLATLMALPRELYGQGVRRYGYHGLSYEYVVSALRDEGVDVDRERIVVAHLGNGASMCAVKAGRSVETTMGFSTLAGLPMGTRCGDLDPGIILYLLAERRMSAAGIERLLYEESGLLGLSGTSRNMQDLLAQRDDPAAAEAIDYFCYRVRAHLAMLTAALEGLDRVVFTGGIGANASAIRKEICDGLGYLGIAVDPKRNADGAGIVSAESSPVIVEARRTDEELMIARHTRQLVPAVSSVARTEP